MRAGATFGAPPFPGGGRPDFEATNCSVVCPEASAGAGLGRWERA